MFMCSVNYLLSDCNIRPTSIDLFSVKVDKNRIYIAKTTTYIQSVELMRG